MSGEAESTREIRDSTLRMILNGLVAEMISRTYHESQDKPTYVIREILESEPERERERARKVLGA